MDNENDSHSQPALQSLDESLRNMSLPCRLIGLNFEARERKLKDDVIYWLNMIWMNLALLGCLHWIYNGIAEGTDMTEITYVAPGAMLGIIGDFKGLFSLANETEAKILLENLRRLEKNIDLNKLSEIELRKSKSALVFLNRVVKLMNTLNIVMLLVYALSPIVLTAMKYYQTKELELMLPYLDIYPFDSYNLRIYPFLYIHQIWAECFYPNRRMCPWLVHTIVNSIFSEAIVLLQICSTDYLFYTCCTYIQIQFTHLQYRLANVVSQYEDNSDHLELRQHFTSLIKWHQDLISNATKLEVITSKSTLSNFVMSSVVICLTGFNVTTTNDFHAIMTFVIFLLMSMIQIFFLCLFGDLLMRSSDVSDAAYNCQWYLSDVSTGKTILLIQIRSQTPCKVTAARFADVNLRAFMKILSTSWSYFALLKTVYGSDRTTDSN